MNIQTYLKQPIGKRDFKEGLQLLTKVNPNLKVNRKDFLENQKENPTVIAIQMLNTELSKALRIYGDITIVEKVIEAPKKEVKKIEQPKEKATGLIKINQKKKQQIS